MLNEELNEIIERILTQKCEMQNIKLKKAEKGTPKNYMIPYQVFPINPVEA